MKIKITLKDYIIGISGIIIYFLKNLFFVFEYIGLGVILLTIINITLKNTIGEEVI